MSEQFPIFKPELGQEVTLRFFEPIPRWKGSSGQMQCGLCGKFLRKTKPTDYGWWYGASEWKCIDMEYDSYYGAWEHR